MDKTAIKRFAVTAKRNLLVSIRSYLTFHYLVTDTNLPNLTNNIIENGSQRRTLTNQETTDFKEFLDEMEILMRDYSYSEALSQLIEKAAFTWFNWVAVVRYMELHNYLPIQMRLLSSERDGKSEPDALTDIYDVIETLDLDTHYLAEIEDSLQSRADKDNSRYQYLLKQQINQLALILPSAFDSISGTISALLPNNLLQKNGLVSDLVSSDIADQDWDDIEIIGWLFQYYNSELKERVGGLKNHNVSKNELPVVTQLFTPKWIVQYMLQNSLGNEYLSQYPATQLVNNWEYYLGHEKPLIAANETQELEQIKIIDPACGSGHILLEAFEMLYQMYQEQGYSAREIPQLILKYNLFGLDIDQRSVQITQLALLLKMLEKQPRFLRRQREPIVFNVYEFKDAKKSISQEALELIANVTEFDAINEVMTTFADAKQFGTLIMADSILNYQQLIERINQYEPTDLYQEALWHELQDCLLPILICAELLKQKYNVVVTNPPYHNKYNPTLKRFMQQNYADVKSDLYSAFIKKTFMMTKKNGYAALMSPYTWMFISSHQKLRQYLIENGTITSLVQLEYSAFEDATVPICTFVIQNQTVNRRGVYLRLEAFKGSEQQPIKTAEAAKDESVDYRYLREMISFQDIPGTPIAYWASDKVRAIFKNNSKLGDIGIARRGLQTGDANKFVRNWYEVSSNSIFNGKSIDYVWVMFNNGGKYRRWFSGLTDIVKWEDNGNAIKSQQNSIIPNEKYYFNKAIVWNKITSGNFGAKLNTNISIQGDAAPFLITERENIDYLLGFMNTAAFKFLLKNLSETLNFQVGDIVNVPIIDEIHEEVKEEVGSIVQQNISLSQQDWDSFETSWDFKTHPLVQYQQGATLIEAAFKQWQAVAEARFTHLKANEEALNKIFIDIYGLQDELSPEETDQDVTVERAKQVREVKSFLSYLVGVIFGRYRLDQPGLAYAGGQYDVDQYQGFKPDSDNIIPIGFEKGYYGDDIVTRIRHLVGLIYGAETVDQNLMYLAQTLYPNDGGQPETLLRKYFLKDFYKDHVKIYRKRPIYWQLDSGKENGFKALIYGHRYDKQTLARVRTDYVLPLLKSIQQLDETTMIEVDSTREQALLKKRHQKYQKQLSEVRQYEAILQYAASREIEINLDDGIKVNYQKFQEIIIETTNGQSEKGNLLTKLKL
ncbi:SAM-dependent methyltransferase [Latilactobacillus sakei]|nr:BREX-1 system adenine-specific DNA-methyltransferase PglX [Latilactobacillus sakei]AUX12763.1 SAM-dependent methyltransferase [Latilactobacillus sakei]